MPKRDLGNLSVAPGVRTSPSTREGWHAIDTMTPELRRFLWSLPVSVDPSNVVDIVYLVGTANAVIQLRSAVDAERRAFSAMHQRRYGCPLPHVSAKATVQPYDAAITRTRRRR